MSKESMSKDSMKNDDMEKNQAYGRGFVCDQLDPPANRAAPTIFLASHLIAVIESLSTTPS
jgi:hypothetical protein